MSKAILDAILNAMQVWLNETEKEQLYHELLAYFGLVGALNECQALENAWQDPYNRREIEQFIKTWLLYRRRRKKEEFSIGLI
ncbi:MAG: hypothetical protein NZ932_05055 [Candidatus Bathyarchaeota archaeon]|nr:hypothetical protein [Candidatus Bathyarchaeota archaeon]MDW8040719.1 hypothetical protein [Nitrososphaerota archaeon]